jgi:glycosyltransferase involved in cell wall biosynthesis
MKTKQSILFILKLPPPYHGSTIMNNYVWQSSAMKNAFECDFVKLSISKDIRDIGKFSFLKIFKIVRDFIVLLRKLIANQYQLVYLALSPLGAAFIKDFIYFQLLRFYNIPVVIHLHGKGMKQKGETNRIFSFLYHYLFSYKKLHVICLSPALFTDIENYYHEQPHYVSNGIPDSNYISNKDIINNKSINLLYLSNFIIEKGIFELIDALEIIFKKNQNFTCKLVGQEKEVTYKHLHKLITQKGLSQNVQIPGPIYNKQKDEVFSESDIFVFPTYYTNECFPLVLLESLKYGVPAVTTAEGAIPDIIRNGETGLFVKKKDAKDLSEKVLYLMNNKTHRKEMSVNCLREFKEKYTLKIFEDNLIDILNSIIHLHEEKNT